MRSGTCVENTQVGPFKIIKKLGTNRRQKVYHAHQTEQNRDVALKFIKLPPHVEWTTALTKIEREVAILKKLKHENLVQVYGAGVHEEQVFFANELVKGESLTSILSRRGKLAPDLAVEYGRQVASMLEYIHAQEILHSKLTPDKILVTQDHKVKVSDLRLNRSRKRRWDATRRRELDIAAYMGPEQFSEGATAKSDFYSLGVIMFEMLTGKLPYEPDTVGRMTQDKLNSPVPSVADHNMSCPIWLDRIVQQLLDPNPRNRPHSARAIGFAFDEIKKIDKTKKAAVAQVSGNFNPLTVGTDKTEANRLLGKKESKQKAIDQPPFYQRIPFLVGALVLIAVVVGIAMLPAKPAHQMKQAIALMSSDAPADWRKARTLFRKVMDNKSVPDSMREEAEEQFYETKRRTLVLQAEKGRVLRTQDRDAQKLGKAIDAQFDGDLTDAKELFAELVESVDPEGENRHIYFESKSRLAILGASPAPLPDNPRELGEAVQDALLASSAKEIAAAKKLLSRIMLEYTDDSDFNEVVDMAKNGLTQLDAAAETLNTTKPDTDSSDPAADTDGPAQTGSGDSSNSD